MILWSQPEPPNSYRLSGTALGPATSEGLPSSYSNSYQTKASLMKMRRSLMRKSFNLFSNSTISLTPLNLTKRKRLPFLARLVGM